MRLSTHALSEVACVGCIDAITFSGASRGKSLALKICACSIRWRSALPAPEGLFSVSFTCIRARNRNVGDLFYKKQQRLTHIDDK